MKKNTTDYLRFDKKRIKAEKVLEVCMSSKECFQQALSSLLKNN